MNDETIEKLRALYTIAKLYRAPSSILDVGHEFLAIMAEDEQLELAKAPAEQPETD